jgi:hypothetical protein
MTKDPSISNNLERNSSSGVRILVLGSVVAVVPLRSEVVPKKVENGSRNGVLVEVVVGIKAVAVEGLPLLLLSLVDEPAV